MERKICNGLTKVYMIHEKKKASQSRQKSCHGKRRKDIEFQVGDHVFFIVNLVTCVGCALKSKKLTPRSLSYYREITTFVIESS